MRNVRALLLLVVVLIVYGSLYPWHFDFSGPPRHPLFVLLNSWPPVWDRFALRDAVVNLLLYAPFGAAAFAVLTRRYSGVFGFAPVLLSAMALSASIEMLQVYVPGRVCSLADVVCNTCGAGAGAALLLALGHSRAGRYRISVSWALPALLLLILFAGYQFSPIFPVLSLTRLHNALRQFVDASRFSLTEAWCYGAEWFAAMTVLRAVISPGPGLLQVLRPQVLLLFLPMRLVVAGRSETLDEVLGAVLAAILWSILSNRIRLRAGVGLMAGALLLRELAPFHFSSTPSPFNWIPFVPTLASEPEDALPVLLHKAFDYGAMVWLLAESGMSYVRAGMCVAAVLAVLEAVQRYLPGRTPETTDAVLTLLMMVILSTVQNFGRRRGLA